MDVSPIFSVSLLVCISISWLNIQCHNTSNKTFRIIFCDLEFVSFGERSKGYFQPFVFSTSTRLIMWNLCVCLCVHVSETETEAERQREGTQRQYLASWLPFIHGKSFKKSLIQLLKSHIVISESFRFLNLLFA